MTASSKMAIFEAKNFTLVAAPRFDRGQDPDELSSFRDQLRNDAAETLLDYWCGLVPTHGFAMRAHFDPLAILPLLPAIYLEDWHAPTEQSRVRVSGEILETLWGGSILGQTVDDQGEGEANALWKECDRPNFHE